MPRIKFTVVYDGRPYAGWQSQPEGNTIQDHLEQAAKELLKKTYRIHGSGRTDAGVHAYGQTFHIDFDTLPTIPLEKWPLAFNTKLPCTIRVIKAEYVEDDFHARFSAIGKQYRYTISTAPIISPFDHGLAWDMPHKLDINLMKQATQLVQGRRDFKSFAALRGNEPSPIPDDYFVRTITQADLTQDDQYIWISFTGEGFLYRMVRLLVGGIYSVGRGRISFDDFSRLLLSPGNDKSPYCAPPDGLFLMNVLY